MLAMNDRVAYIDAMTGQQLMTADELLRLHLPDKRSELIRGRLIVREPAGGRHGYVASRNRAPHGQPCK